MLFYLKYSDYFKIKKVRLFSQTKDKQWLEKYGLAKKYFEDNGDLLIPIDYKTINNIKLEVWINTQRKN